MRQAFASWPEMIFIDNTYNLLKRKLPLLLMCVRDTMGLTHIIGVGLLANEQKDTLRSLFQNFKNVNGDVSNKIECFMTDKDLTERAVIKEVFPGTILYMCEFHVLNIFSRQITTSSMKTTSKQRDIALDLLDKLTKSNTREQYEHLYEIFCKTVEKTVLLYYNHNWHNITEGWTRYSLSKNNYGNYTNNPVESTNARMKYEIPLHSTLVQFGVGFFRYYNRRNEAIKMRMGEDIYKHPIRGYPQGSPEYLYQRLLTPAGFKKVIVEFFRRKPMSFIVINNTLQLCWIRYGYAILRVSTEVCEYNEYTSIKLPCRHIFAVRDHFRLPLFHTCLCPERWTMQYNIENQPVLRSTPNIQRCCLPSYTTHKTPSKKQIAFSTRFKLMKEVAGSIASIGSTATSERFEERLNVLRKIESSWRKNKSVQVILEDDDLSHFSQLFIGDQNESHNRNNERKQTIAILVLFYQYH